MSASGDPGVAAASQADLTALRERAAAIALAAQAAQTAAGQAQISLEEARAAGWESSDSIAAREAALVKAQETSQQEAMRLAEAQRTLADAESAAEVELLATPRPEPKLRAAQDRAADLAAQVETLAVETREAIAKVPGLVAAQVDGVLYPALVELRREIRHTCSLVE